MVKGRLVNGGLATISRRYLLQHPLQTGLTLLGIMLGVAIVVAIDLANFSAKRAFALSMEMTSGSATHAIKGGSGGIPEHIYRRLRTERGMRDSAPLVSDEVRAGEQRLTLLGLDVFARNFALPAAQAFSTSDSSGQSLAAREGRRLFLEPGTVAMTRQTAERLGINLNDKFFINYRGQSNEIKVVNVFESDHPATTGVLIADIAVAQELLGRVGVLDRIDLALDDASAIAELKDWLPPGLTLIEAETRRGSMARMTDAFHTNLTAMSLLALLVGGFLIYNTMMFAVLRRREQFGALRSLGVSRRELFTMVFTEAAVLGLVATGAGLLAGIALGQVLVQLVTVTINDLYYRLHVSELFISEVSLLKGFLLGFVVTAVAAWLPARGAARATPVSLQQRSSLEGHSARFFPWLFGTGVLITLAGWWLAQLPGRSIVIGFVALAMVVIGFSMAVPLLVQWLCTGLRTITTTRGSLLTRLSIRGISAGLSRTGLAVAALTIAVATTLGVGIMISSFRITVSDWLEQTLNSDVYVTIPGSASAHAGAGLPEALIAQLEQHPDVNYSWGNRVLMATTDTGPVRLMAIEYDPRHGRGFNLKAGDPDQARAAFAAGQGLLISEPYAYHQQLTVGDPVTFMTPKGPAAIKVLGIFIDYTSDSGLVLMPIQQYQRLWQDETISSLGLFRSEGTSEAELAASVRSVVDPFSESIRVRANAEIRALSMEIFDRTFTVTRVLQLLSVIVAFIGVLSALMALQLEKTREFALLRASGITPAEIQRMILGQTLVMGVFAGLLALPLGYLMSTLLIEVINVRSFGWTMQQVVPLASIWQALLLAMAAAFLAGIYPAINAARMPIARSLREE